MIVLAVGLGAAIGACLRYLITTYFKQHFMALFPLATLIINLSGAFILGLVFRFCPPSVYAVLGTGILGGYTTFSTFNVELLALVSNRRYLLAWLYLLVSVLGGLLLMFLALL